MRNDQQQIVIGNFRFAQFVVSDKFYSNQEGPKMKRSISAFLAIVPLVCFAAEVEVGNSADEVRSALGQPRGELRAGERQVLYYDRGEVELRDGTVARVALLSPEEHQEAEARRSAAAQRAREEAEVLRAKLKEEGESLKARKLADASFQSSPLSYQVAFWRDFARRYPDVPSAEQLTVAQLRLTQEQEGRRVRDEQDSRIAELEARVADVAERAEERQTIVYQTPSYSSYYHRYHHRHGDDRSDPWPVSYRFYETPLPYASTPGVPPVKPKYAEERPGTTRPNFPW